jgi:5-methylcytosine-specific restriction endonuclease McrA
MDEQYKRWYKSKRWQRLRREVLSKHPMCQCQHCKGVNLEANVVDHIKPHRGRDVLFWDKSNLQAMNKQCHDRYKQSQEKGGHGFEQGCDINGAPLSEDHPWNEKHTLH